MKTVAVLSFLLALASATPVEVVSIDEGGSLAKRDTEMIYLVNCRSSVSCCTPDKHYSTIAVSFLKNLSHLLRHQSTHSVLPTVLRGQRPVPQRRDPRHQQRVHRQSGRLRLLGVGHPEMHLSHGRHLHRSHRLGCSISGSVLVGWVSHCHTPILQVRAALTLF